MRALSVALDAAAAATAGGDNNACSSPRDMREARRKSIRQRYRERSEHFRLIQAARDTASTEGSALLRVMRQRRQVEEDDRKVAEERALRILQLKNKITMRLMEGRRGVFLAWARHARRSRGLRLLLARRATSLATRMFSAWKEEARNSRRAREFALKYMSGSKRTAFMAWKGAAKRSIAARRVAVGRLQDRQTACFLAWKDHARLNARHREMALLKSAAARSAIQGLSGTRGLFARWRSWASKNASAKRMALRSQQAGLRRCFLALADHQVKVRSRLEARRLAALGKAFVGWRVGLGCLLRARLTPIAGYEKSGAKGVGREDWDADDGGGGGRVLEAGFSAQRGGVELLYGARAAAVRGGGAGDEEGSCGGLSAVSEDLAKSSNNRVGVATGGGGHVGGEEEEGSCGGGGVSCASDDLAKSSNNHAVAAAANGDGGVLEKGPVSQDEEEGISTTAAAGVWIACEAQEVERRGGARDSCTPPALLPSAFFVSGVASRQQAAMTTPVRPLRRASEEG